MSNTDSSSSARLRQVKAKTLATFRANNPIAKEGGGSKSVDASVITERASGVYPVIRQMDRKPAQVTSACCSCVSVRAPTDITWTIDTYFPNIYTWTPSPGTTYTFSSTDPTVEYTDITNSSVAVNYTWNGGNDPGPTFTITARNSCSSATSAPVQTNPCFLAGSLVTMADGTQKPIEDVQCGDELLGTFGEINQVLALHRPLLGTASMIRINDEHSSTAHHPHIGVDRGFYCANISALEGATYGKEHEVLNADGKAELRFLQGLNPGRVQMYETGMALKTAEGSRILQTLEHYSLPADTQLYNLVMSGSHTYHVDGYAVTGWPSEKDFDYDHWVPII